MTEPLPSTGRLIGIDFGTVRIGIAITDTERRLASPYENYTRQDLAADTRFFKQLVTQETVVGFVIGLPVYSDGEESAKSREARAFGQWLLEVTGIPVTFYDERYTTAQAEQLLITAELTRKRKKKRLDMIAAQIILASYLESSGQGTESPGALDHRGDDPG